jgi:integrase/recombinase XerD
MQATWTENYDNRQKEEPPMALTEQLPSQLEKRIILLTANLERYCKSLFLKLAKASGENAQILADFITAEQNEINIKDSTKEWKIKIIFQLSAFHEHEKSFEDMTKDDILAYLNKLRKPESDDPTHKWIGTYNNRQMLLNKFFRWLYNPDEPDHRQRITPPCMRGIKRLPRKEKSPHKPSDIWTNEEHAIFLKYCPMKRDRCYHAMAYDTSARPHELLRLKIKDIKFKLSPDGIQYAEILVSGKTRPRTLPLISFIPYIKEWLQEHPLRNNPEAALFLSLGDSNYGRPITRDGLWWHFAKHYRTKYFPRLLNEPSVPATDKEHIKSMIAKPWNLYIFRHSALTQKSQILKETTLRDHAGWTMSSKMPQVYLHYFGTESSNSLLEAYGIIKHSQKQIEILKSKACPNRNEPNKPDERFCFKCKMVLTYDGYKDTLNQEEAKEERLKVVQDRLQDLYRQLYKQGLIKDQPRESG